MWIQTEDGDLINCDRIERFFWEWDEEHDDARVYCESGDTTYSVAVFDDGESHVTTDQAGWLLIALYHALTNNWPGFCVSDYLAGEYDESLGRTAPVSDKEPTQPCPECGGDGKGPFDDDCMLCGGTGRIQEGGP
jgi:hypothetical protein